MLLKKKDISKFAHNRSNSNWKCYYKICCLNKYFKIFSKRNKFVTYLLYKKQIWYILFHGKKKIQWDPYLHFEFIKTTNNWEELKKKTERLTRYFYLYHHNSNIIYMIGSRRVAKRGSGRSNENVVLLEPYRFTSFQSTQIQ